MANRWGIPKDVENLVLKRDKCCVYCNINFSINHLSRKTKPSWEHIINDIKLNTEKNIALCCVSCNSSKGSKDLLKWFDSKYCQQKNITKDTVSEVVKQVLENM